MSSYVSEHNYPPQEHEIESSNNLVENLHYLDFERNFLTNELTEINDIDDLELNYNNGNVGFNDDNSRDDDDSNDGDGNSENHGNHYRNVNDEPNLQLNVSLAII